jgi:hypothetical protein
MAGDQAPGRTEPTDEIGLRLRTDDGTTYLIPRAALETFRLSDKGQAALARQEAEAGDVRGHGQYIGQFSMTMPVWVPVAWGARATGRPAPTRSIPGPPAIRGGWAKLMPAGLSMSRPIDPGPRHPPAARDGFACATA